MSTSLTACRRITSSGLVGRAILPAAGFLAGFFRSNALSRLKGRLQSKLAAPLLLGAALLIAQTSRSVWDGVYTSEQASRGAAQYSTNCAPWIRPSRA